MCCRLLDVSPRRVFRHNCQAGHYQPGRLTGVGGQERGLVPKVLSTGLSSTRMQNLVLAHVIAVAALQTAKHNRRSDGQDSEADERFVDSSDELGWLSAHTGYKECGGQPRSRHSKADRHLLHRACDGTCTAGVFL